MIKHRVCNIVFELSEEQSAEFVEWHVNDEDFVRVQLEQLACEIETRKGATAQAMHHMELGLKAVTRFVPKLREKIRELKSHDTT